MHYLSGGLIFYMGFTFYMSEQVSTIMLHFDLLVSIYGFLYAYCLNIKCNHFTILNTF